MEKTRCPLSLVAIFKNYFFVWLNFTAESVNCSLFFEKSRKNIFTIRLTKKKLRQTHRKFTATFIGKIYRRYFIDYRFRFKKLRFIDYRYCPGLFWSYRLSLSLQHRKVYRAHHWSCPTALPLSAIIWSNTSVRAEVRISLAKKNILIAFKSVYLVRFIL